MAVNKKDLVQNDFIIDYGRIEDIGANIEPAVLYQDLIKRIRDYHPSEDFTSIRAAYELAYSAHEDQLRKNGEPYIICLDFRTNDTITVPIVSKFQLIIIVVVIGISGIYLTLPIAHNRII